jgi:hypothetical protein
LRAGANYAIGVADSPEDDRISATLVIEVKGGVDFIVDDGKPEPELIGP